MISKLFLAMLIVCGVIKASALAQAPAPIIEYGDESELKGVNKIFVNTGPDVDLRKAIIQEIHKQLPDLQIVSRFEDAEIHIRFYYDERRAPNPNYPERPDLDIVVSRDPAAVVERPINNDRVRIIARLKLIPTGWGGFIPNKQSFKDANKPYPTERGYARFFVKIYKEANAKH